MPAPALVVNELRFFPPPFLFAVGSIDQSFQIVVRQAPE
jgi:hypothetical protein